MYLSNDREHVATCQGNSSIPTNATHPLHRGHGSTNLAVTPLFTPIRWQMKTCQLCVRITTCEVAWSFAVLCETQAA